jgi:hypothetical protein
LLNSERIEYLLVGGFAVAHYGHPRATGDMDIWIAVHQANAEGMVRVLRQFGFSAGTLSPDLFLRENKIVRMGMPPLRIELLTGISGVDFASCYANRSMAVVEDVAIPIIGLEDLKTNKRAAGRTKDLGDLEALP